MKPQSTSVSVVLVGRFTPSSGLLTSLVTSKAISRPDADQVTYTGLLDGQYVELALPWGKLAIVTDRMSVEALQAPYVRAADLAVKYVRELEPRSKVQKLGINVKCVYRFTDSARRDELGIRLVPPQSWGPWGAEVAKSMSFDATHPSHGGMTVAVVRQGKLDDREGGWTDARVDAGGYASDGFDVTVSINDHYEIPPTIQGAEALKLSDGVVTSLLLERLEGCFDSAVHKAFTICQGIVSGYLSFLAPLLRAPTRALRESASGGVARPGPKRLRALAARRQMERRSGSFAMFFDN